MKKEGICTIWIFRSGPFKPLKFKLPFPYRTARILVVVVLAMIVSFPFITMNYISQSLQMRKQTTHVAYLNKKVEDFQQQIQRLKEFDVKLRIIANLENAQDTGASFLAVGGLTPPSHEPLHAIEADTQRIRAELDRLSTEAEFREKSFQELYSFLEGKKRQLSSTPSIWPVRGWLTSGFGYRIDPFTGLRQFHEGLDIANRHGTPILAPADGVVSRCSNNTGFGLTVEINHGYGIKTIYGHLSKTYVGVGQGIKRGQRIAAVGNSGRATGPHLHYEVRLNDVPMNPLSYILN
jgi:murein DD-endopeptidase MepM/ murein hydrolase activator NlpD